MILIRIAVMLALMVAAAPAAAQMTTTTTVQQPTFTPLPPETEGLTFTPFLGLGFAGDYENTPASFGGALGYGVSPRVAIEGELYLSPGGEQGVLAEFDTSVVSFAGNLLYHFAEEDFTPYATIGIGYIYANADTAPTGIETDEADRAFAWNWGAGVKSAVSDRFGLRADLRYFNASELVPDHWRVYGGVVIRNIGR